MRNTKFFKWNTWKYVKNNIATSPEHTENQRKQMQFR